MSQSVIGAGEVGFTAAGLDLLETRILQQLELPSSDEVSIEVPPYVVVAADLFAAFEERNQIDPEALTGLSDRQIARQFQRAELPAGFRVELKKVLEVLDGPLIVRPSSTVEAAIRRSFGGVYTAKLIPNVEQDVDKRLRHLVEAVQLVWASTYFADAVSSRLGAGQARDSERMALVIQQVLGVPHGDRFYPTISAVARSYNHYPAPGNEPGEGVVSLALGLGRIIADGHAWSYCPERPTAPPPFKGVADLLKYTQTSFFAVDLAGGGAPDPSRDDEFLVRLSLADAERDGTLELLASTYDAESDRLRSGFDGRGPRALTFAPLLRSRAIPFTSVISRMVDQARDVTGGEVEVELTATLDPVSGVPVRFGVVQLKTMAGRSETESLQAADLGAEDVVVASDQCLGNGRRVDLVDLIYLKPEVFDRNRTRTIAAELEAVNRGLLDEGRSGVFVGFGRWGTTDDRYGVPVRWGQISSAQVIVEITIAGAPLNLSQGTHFFHHILSQHVMYLSIEHDGPHAVDFDWLDAQPIVWEGQYVRHVRTERPVEVNVDGATSLGVVRRVAKASSGPGR